MGRSRPVYNEIKALRKQLDDAASAVKKSRAASERLLQLLSDPDMRRRLAAEATPEHGNDAAGQQQQQRSVQAIRRTALAEMWRVLIQSAVTSVHLIARGKSKLTESDIRFPYKMLELCDKPDEVFFEETGSKLSKEQIKVLYSYCIGMLDDEHVLQIDGAEKTLLTMLAYICARREFVVYFRPDQHITAILEEVEKRLLVSQDDEDGPPSLIVPREIVQLAAKIFGTLLSTCEDLGIGLHLILPGTIKLVATWCHQNEQERSVEEATHLLSGAAILLRSSPDLALASITRHGRPILQTVKRSLAKLDLQKAAKPYVAALTEYLLRYLIVCQVAGKLQGLMPGDLGNLGTGSLSYKTVSHLLDLLIQSIGTHTSVAGKLSYVYKAQLELTARLLACAQRMFLVRNEWNEMDDPTQVIITDIEHQPNVHDYYSLERTDEPYPTCAPSTLAESPFVSLVLRHICALAPGSFVSSATTAGAAGDSNDSQTRMESQTGQERTAARTTASKNPWIEALSLAMEGLAANEKSLIASLHIVSSTAEIFPLGACWTASTQNNWRVVSVEGDSTTTSESIAVNGGSSYDLAVVVEIICNILEAHGGFNASSEIQKWTLICLSRMTIATEALSLSSTENSAASQRHGGVSGPLCSAQTCAIRLGQK